MTSALINAKAARDQCQEDCHEVHKETFNRVHNVISGA